MKFIDEFRNKEIAQGLIRRIFEVSTSARQPDGGLRHAHRIFFSFGTGFERCSPKHIRLLSGPGCPVCVTPNQDIDLPLP